jgi:stalled ribosome rescue protein Dom34
MTDVKSHGLTGRLHAVVWIDHHEARISRFDSEVTQATHHTIKSDHPQAHLHHKANSIGSGHAHVDAAYLERVAADISDARAILIAGPSSAKHELYKHITQRHPAIVPHVMGVETLDHPTQGELLAHAARSFLAAERMGRPYSPDKT